MENSRTGLLGILKQSIRDFMKDDCMTSAAALSYYTVFSLPAILMLIMLLVSSVMDPTDVRGGLESQLEALMGPSAGAEVRTILQKTERPGGGLIPTIVGIVALVFGATGALGQLQAALNRTWNVEPDPQQGGLKSFLTKRLFSFGMLLSIAFLLLVSLVISATLSALGDRLTAFLPAGLSEPVLQALNIGISLLVISLLFATMFKVLPDAKVAWRSAWIGGVATALLFVLGKFLIGLYIGKSNPGEAYGAAGSLIVMLLWIYYSAIIVLFGAEFTETWAEKRGEGIEPEAGAVRVRQEKQQIREGREGREGWERREGRERRERSA
ncbi:MAG TPA: YihY/virulence factor BrkB family protein [Gemmatimonadales bacterium]|nr:YihY/virulence factor BrkB family protein [Gemmatimonadales bacterium]